MTTNKSKLQETSLRPGIPIKPETIKSWGNDIKAAWDRMGCCYAQPKYDGWQIQIHVSSGKITLYSRQCNDLTIEFPDVVNTVSTQVTIDNVILDSEVVPYDPVNKKIRPWSEMSSAEYHKILVFDVLYINGIDCTNNPEMPFQKRLEAIQGIIQQTEGNLLELVSNIFVEDFNTLESFYLDCLKNDFEGIIVKSPAAIYKPGKRNSAKGKIKSRDNLDVVILGYCSVGKTIKWIQVGVQKGENEFASISTVYHGINGEIQDILLAKLSRNWKTRIDASQLDMFGKMTEETFKVEPKIVIEIEVSYILRSNKSYTDIGYTLEHPKLKRIREDKETKDANTVEDFFKVKSKPGQI